MKVTGIEMNDAEHFVAICKKDRYKQAISLVDLPLPKARPEGWEWIEAYRLWASLLVQVGMKSCVGSMHS